MDEALHWLSADELARLYRSRDISPVEVADSVLDRLEAVNSKLNAMVTVTADTARSAAREAERRFRQSDAEELPPLYGVPITVKDLCETAGVRTTYGCEAYKDFVPDEDGLAWERLKANGAILIGKTTTPEFGLLGVAESKLTGSTGNPWKPSCNAGGSSGGAAAAVVAGIGPVAWGSDGGGSIRVPSSLCGAVGIKPSVGRIPHAHNTDSDSTEGPITRTVLDAAVLLDATVGPHRLDRLTLPRTGERFAAIAREEGDLSGIRIAACTDLGQKVVDPEVRRVFGAALDDMRAAGATVVDVGITLPDTSEFFDKINSASYLEYAQHLTEAGIEVWPLITDLASRAHNTSGIEASWAFTQGRTQIYEAFLTAMADADVMVTPTTAVPAFPHAGDYGPVVLVDGQEVPPLGLLIHAMTEPPSHAGLPALSILGGFTSQGLPVGLQFIGPLHGDRDVIRAAARYERATTWHTHHPDL